MTAAVQPVGAPGAFPVFPPTTQTTASQDATGATVMLHSQFTSPVEQTVSSKKVCCTVSLTGAFHSEAQDFDMNQDSEPASPTWATDEEGEVSGWESAKPEECNQEVSEEQTYREIIKGVKSFIGWTQVPEFKCSTRSLDDNPFACTRTQSTSKVSVKLLTDEWLCKGKWRS